MSSIKTGVGKWLPHCHTFFTTVAASLVGKLPDITGGYAGNFVYKYYQDKGAKQNSSKYSPVGERETF